MYLSIENLISFSAVILVNKFYNNANKIRIKLEWIKRLQLFAFIKFLGTENV